MERAERLRLRVANSGDIPTLVEIRARVNENQLRDLSIGPADYLPYVLKNHCWIFEGNDAPVGFVALNAGSASIWALFVVPEAQGRGIGRQLLCRAVAEARGIGLAHLKLYTESGTRAEQFYLAAGWVIADRDNKGTLDMSLIL